MNIVSFALDYNI